MLLSSSTEYLKFGVTLSTKRLSWLAGGQPESVCPPCCWDRMDGEPGPMRPTHPFSRFCPFPTFSCARALLVMLAGDWAFPTAQRSKEAPKNVCLRQPRSNQCRGGESCSPLPGSTPHTQEQPRARPSQVWDVTLQRAGISHSMMRQSGLPGS